MKIKIWALSIVALTLNLACEDILEEDISNDTIQLILPQNNQQVTSNVTNFQWSQLSGADKYRLQVMRNSMGIVLDTLIANTSFNWPLTQGEYQWRVRGENSAYQSLYSFNNNFIVIESLNLSNQQVLLNAPTNNFFTNNTSITFSWLPLSAAQSYVFELINVTNGESVVTQIPNITTNSLNISNNIISQNAQYRWKIKAINSTSETAFASRDFFIDTNAPNIPANSTPPNNTTSNSNQNINFSWNSVPDFGPIQATISFTIEFSNNINFSTIIQTTDAQSNNITLTFANPGEYFWRIKARDAAGNVSLPSSPFKFIIN